MTHDEKIDIKPLMKWAQSNSEAKIVDRVLLKLMPQLLKSGVNITEQMILEEDECVVSAELYEHFLRVTQELVGKSFDQGVNNV